MLRRFFGRLAEGQLAHILSMARKSNRLWRSVDPSRRGVKALGGDRDDLQEMESAIVHRCDTRENVPIKRKIRHACRDQRSRCRHGLRAQKAPVTMKRFDRGRNRAADRPEGVPSSDPPGSSPVCPIREGRGRWRRGRLTDVVRDLADRRGIGDERDDPHRCPARRAEKRKQLVEAGQ
jgi:hypothetical protein